jgi:hypothetical protein
MTNRQSHQRLGASALLTAVVLSAVGCSAGVTLREDADIAVVTDAGFLTGDDAAISGTVSLTEAGCMGITDDQGHTYPTIWPRGSALVAGSKAGIDIPGVGVKQLGERVNGAGGYYETKTRPILDEVAERCAWDGEVIGIRFD